ncbi:hypothetical protein ZWY2020_013538 [Hordeum vulgare]|nr:hypothetical protein ZWY2020_013538 [Hordeum vulgare]
MASVAARSGLRSLAARARAPAPAPTGRRMSSSAHDDAARTVLQAWKQGLGFILSVTRRDLQGYQIMHIRNHARVKHEHYIWILFIARRLLV